MLELLLFVVYQLVTLFGKRFQKLFSRWGDMPATKKLRGARSAAWFAGGAWLGNQLWKFVQAWWERQDGVITQPDPSGGTDFRYRLDYTWTDLGRDLRRIAARLMSSLGGTKPPSKA